MELHHEFVVPLSIEKAWEAFNDLERIGPAFPGAAVTGVDGDAFTGTAKVKLGPVSLQYTGTGKFASRDAEGKRAVIEASGRDKRGNGTAGATITASLQEEGPQSTRVLLDTDLKITGRPAQFGRGVIQDVGGKILDQFAANLTTLLSTPAVPEPAAEPAEEVVDAAPVQETSAEVAEASTGPDRASGTGAPAAASPALAEVPRKPVQPVAARPVAARPAPEPEELDLGSVVGPALFQRYGVTIGAVVVTAVLTWFVARRRG